jgi:predicted MFS family arabinose efflux permease
VAHAQSSAQPRARCDAGPDDGTARVGPRTQVSVPPRRTLPLLTAANFASASAGMVVAGLLQLIAADLAWPPARAGSLIMVYALGFAIGAPVLGVLVGTWCRKTTIVLGLGLVAAGSVLGALATSTWPLLVARVVVAAGAALTLPSVSAVAAYLYPEDRAAALATVLNGVTAALVFGVPLGTWLGGVAGWHATLACAGALAAAAAVAIKWLLPGGIVVPPVPLATWARILRESSTYRVVAPPLVFTAATFTLYAYIGPFLHAVVGLGAGSLAGLLFEFGVVSLAANAVLASLAHRVGEPRLQLASTWLLAAALGAMVATTGRPALVAVLFVPWAIANTFFTTLQQSRVSAESPGTVPALLALNTSAAFAGQALGTAVGGVAMALGGPMALPPTAALVAAASGGLVWIAHASRRAAPGVTT